MNVQPGASAVAIRALAAFRAEQPALARWITEGHPTLTDAQHVQRFGLPYKARRGGAPPRT